MSALAREPVPDASLEARLHARIARDGPLTVEDFMQACLSDEAAGVYASRQPIGGKGDFITSPEISQIFGELVGLWAVAVWQSMGEPSRVTIAELGPGRGTLTADASRTWRGVPKFLDSVSVALIETSPVMFEAQRRTLKDSGAPLRWYAALDAVPEGPLIVIANEFVDALPVRQFIRRGEAWRERLIASDGKGGFAFTDSEAQDEDRRLPQTALDDVILETRPAAQALMRELGRRAEHAPLAALIIDYGHAESGFGDTLQAVRGHRFADVLANPGAADLSAHVDFADLKRAAVAAGLNAHGPMPQGEFLLKLGLAARRERLLQRATPTQAEAIASGAARLVDPRQMGVLFKALALASAGLPPPPPFGHQHFALS
ncbi:class I SAM-dependent methyltransferase [Methyloceanibacter sp.]|uniref:class I SAM-dependent methyltransferase n=1 Tax=Methyloceanibacter sp. TaxID=1965321 RepID=UPI00351B1B15